MSNNDQQWGGPYQGQGGYGPGGYGPGGYGPGGYGPAGYGAGPQAQGSQGAGNGRIDALDVLEGMLRDGFSLGNFARIARASGSNFWIGAAIGAGAVVLMNRPDVRSAFTHAFRHAKPEPAASQADADKTAD